MYHNIKKLNVKIAWCYFAFILLTILRHFLTIFCKVRQCFSYKCQYIHMCVCVSSYVLTVKKRIEKNGYIWMRIKVSLRLQNRAWVHATYFIRCSVFFRASLIGLCFDMFSLHRNINIMIHAMVICFVILEFIFGLESYMQLRLYSLWILKRKGCVCTLRENISPPLILRAILFLHQSQ